MVLKATQRRVFFLFALTKRETERDVSEEDTKILGVAGWGLFIEKWSA